MADKLDLKREYPEAYKATKTVEEVKLGPAHYLTFDGHGEPGDASFRNAFSTLYAVAYDIKSVAKEEGDDFAVPPAEALYWTHGDNGEMLPKEDWKWRVLMRMPPGTTSASVDHAKDRVEAKRGDLPVMHVGFDKLHEGRSVQVLHEGSYDQVQGTVGSLMAHIGENGLEPDGAYHEVYLNDPGRTAPADLKTILRMPVK